MFKKKISVFISLAMILQMIVSMPIISKAETVGNRRTPQRATLNEKVDHNAIMAETQKLIDAKPDMQRKMEYLDRGLVAAKCDDGVFVSWRWLGTESINVKFNIYRDNIKINALPLDVTNFMDVLGNEKSKYYLSTVIDGIESEKSMAIDTWASNGYDIKFERPEGIKNIDGTTSEYNVNDMSTGDLDGDGKLDLIVKWDGASKDNSQDGVTSPVILDGYKLDGTRLWRINLGPNIRAGAHYTQFMVYDLDGDGKAEVVCKTADGTTDGAGTVIGDAKKNYVGASGRILEGPEYLTVFKGQDGTIMDTIDYVVPRGSVSSWGDGYGNRLDRYLAGIAYLDGKTPSVIMCRGYYTRTVLVAFNIKDGKFEQLWKFDSNDAGSEYTGQGNHQLSIADVDFDGYDEIVYGAMCIDHDGKPLYNTGFGHGDAMHVGDLIPSRPGLEVFDVHESQSSPYGYEMRDARTGDVIWGDPTGGDNGRGASDDIDPRYEGAESWTAGKMFNAAGEVICNKPSIAQNFLAYWDGDLGREVQDGNHIDKWNYETGKAKAIFTAKDHSSINGTKSNPCLTADILGDWREETIYPTKDKDGITIYTTTTPTNYRIPTLMHDAQYRLSIAWQNVAYNQPAHTGYYLGFNTKEIPVYSMYAIDPKGNKLVNPDLTAKVKNYSINDLNQGTALALTIGSPKALSDGKILRVDEKDDKTVPIIKDGRTLVPVRFIAEAFGAKVEFDDATKKITITKEDVVNKTTKNIQLKLDSADYTVDGKPKTLDVVATAMNDRTFIPLRAMAEALDKEVGFNGTNKLIYISDKIAEFSDDDAAVISNTIDKANLPAAKEDVVISAKKLLEKQLQVVKVDAIGNDGNVPEGAVDGDMTTRWTAFDKDATLWVDLGSEKEVAGVAIAHWKGQERIYSFDIEVSSDGKNWTPVLTDKKNLTQTENFEQFMFQTTQKTRYVRYVGHGNNQKNNNNILEFAVLGK